MSMSSSQLQAAARDYAAVEKAIAAMQSKGKLPLEAESVFQRWAGNSAQAFFESLTKAHLKALLEGDQPSPGASEFGDPDLDISCELLKPGPAKPFKGIIRYGTCPTPFGKGLIALSERGICAFYLDGELAELQAKWKGAEFKKDPRAVEEIRIFSGNSGATIPVHLRGTEFQISVWLALLSLPLGTLTTYHALAQNLGKPEATRAVASAIAGNEICYLVPCHRVIRTGGIAGEYRWGSIRKQAMIGWEAACCCRGGCANRLAKPKAQSAK